MSGRFLRLIACLAMLLCWGMPARAADKLPDRIRLIIGYEAGAPYDITGRFIAPLLSKHLPGNPQVLPENMPGAGSLIAANYIYNSAPHDGSVIGLVAQGIQLMEILRRPGIQFESAKFTWLGRMTEIKTLIGVWHAVPVETIADTKKTQVVIAVGGPLSGSTLYVAAIDAIAGTKLKPIMGYGSRDALLAMERGEIDGTSSLEWSQLKNQYPSWITEKKIRILVQVGTKRGAELPDVPLMSELGATDADRQLLNAIASSDIGRSLLAPPGVPPDVAAVLRKGLSDALADPDAVKTLEKLKMATDLAPLDGETLQASVERTSGLPPELLDRIRQLAAKK